MDARSLAAWENFRQRVTELGGVVLEPEWLGSNKKHRCRCTNGHECRPQPDSVQQGQGICRTCVGQDSTVAWANFRQRVTEFGGVVLETEWLGSNKKHRCRCIQGHECRPRPGHVQEGVGICSACAGNNPAAAEEDFHRRVTELGGVVLEPEWLGVHKPHRCRCAEGHECRPRPARVQQGRGICLTCAHQDPATAQENFRRFRRLVAELGGVVLEREWLGNIKPHLCRCRYGHECRPTPANIQRGQGICRTCAWREQDALYVTRNPATGCVKFGITTRDGRARLGTHHTDGYTELLRLETGLPEGLAALTEQKIKLALEMAGAVPVRGYEYFSGEHLALIFNEIDNWVPLTAA